MSDDQILDELLAREGGFRAAVRRPDGTIDPPTMFGITAPVYGNWLGLARPATVEELKRMPRESAIAIYRAQFITQPGFTREDIGFEPLRVQLIDFGVNSGPARAVRWLQRVLRVPATGRLDLPTRARIRELGEQGLLPIVNDALVGARTYMVDRAVDTGAMRREDEEGVESRALSFLLCAPREETPVRT